MVLLLILRAISVRNILAIIQDVISTPLQAPITILTAAHRDHWATSRNHLLSISPINRQSLTTIEDAIFAFSLDDHGVGSNTSEWSRNAFTGQGKARNRWFDKSLNFVVEANGKCALLGEHSPCDALTASYVFDHMLKKPCPAGASTSSVKPSKSGILVQRLAFETDKTMDKYLEEAKQDAAKTIALSDTTVLIWDQYGTDWVKKVGKVSPDAFFQMCLQLAYYKIHKHVTPTYETASTRQFLHGRTETIRTCSVDSKKFVESWDNKDIDVSKLGHTRFNDEYIGNHPQQNANLNNFRTKQNTSFYRLLAKAIVHTLRLHPTDKAVIDI
jgi:carnitine O-acetyltransferase